MLHSIFLSHTLHTIQFQRLAESLIAKSMLGSHMSLILIICENLYKSHFSSPYGPQNACISERYFLRRTNQTTLLDVEEATDITSLLSDLINSKNTFQYIIIHIRVIPTQNQLNTKMMIKIFYKDSILNPYSVIQCFYEV